MSRSTFSLCGSVRKRNRISHFVFVVFGLGIVSIINRLAHFYVIGTALLVSTKCKETLFNIRNNKLRRSDYEVNIRNVTDVFLIQMICGYCSLHMVVVVECIRHNTEVRCTAENRCVVYGRRCVHNRRNVLRSFYPITSCNRAAKRQSRSNRYDSQSDCPRSFNVFPIQFSFCHLFSLSLDDVHVVNRLHISLCVTCVSFYYLYFFTFHACELIFLF